MFWWLVTASLPLRGNSEGHVVQSEAAEHLMRLWCCIAECVLFNLIKMLIASSDIVKLPNKKESPLPKWGSDIRTGNIFGFNVIYPQHNLQTLCAGLKSHPAMESSGRDWGRCEHFGVSPHCSPMPGQQQSWALQSELCSSSALAPSATQEGGLVPKQMHYCNLLAAITTEVWKNTPLLVHHGVDNKAGNLEEHPRGNKGRLNVIFITDTLVWLEKVVTVQEAFSVISQFSITEDINPKPNKPLLTKIFLMLFILLPCCSLWAFSLLACLRWF